MLEQQIEHYALLAAICLLIPTLLLAMLALVVVMLGRGSVSRPEVGPFCAGCAQPLRADPVSALATDQVSLVVYECPRCRTKTYLPNGGAE